MTNATKAQIIAVTNALFGALVSFGDFNETQSVALVGLVNAALVAWVALTYKKSSKRVSDAVS